MNQIFEGFWFVSFVLFFKKGSKVFLLCSEESSFLLNLTDSTTILQTNCT